MIPLSSALIQAKNEIESDEAWLVCLDLISPDNETELYLILNTEDVTIDEQLYQAFPFEIDEISENSTGGIGQFILKVSNIDRVIQGYIEQDATFGSGWLCRISVYHTSQLGGSPEIVHDFLSLNCTCDINFASFSIGVDNPLMAIFPRQKYSAGLCQRVFKDGLGCDYSGEETECNKTIDDCKIRFSDYLTRVNGSGERIGLPILIFPAVPSRAIYL